MFRWTTWKISMANSYYWDFTPESSCEKFEVTNIHLKSLLNAQESLLQPWHSPQQRKQIRKSAKGRIRKGCHFRSLHIRSNALQCRRVSQTIRIYLSLCDAETKKSGFCCRHLPWPKWMIHGCSQWHGNSIELIVCELKFEWLLPKSCDSLIIVSGFTIFI